MVRIIFKFAYCWVLFIPIFFYQATYLMRKNKLWSQSILLNYATGLLFILLIYKNYMIENFHLVFNSFYFHTATPIFTISFIWWLILFTISNVQLYLHYKKTYSPKGSYLIFMIVINFIGYTGGIFNFLPAYGFNLYPWGNFIANAPGIAISYAILRHQFLDIQVVYKRSFAYSILILLGALIYFIVILISEKIIQDFWGYKSFTVTIFAAFTIGIVFFPLHNYIQKLVDKVIFHKTTEEISNENQLLRAEVVKSEKMKSVALLASGMAHEIKNPLTAIKTFSEFLPQKLNDKEFLLKFSKIVGSEVNRIDALVNELLEFAKPAPLQVKETNLNKLITDTIDLLNSKLLMHNITVEFDLSPECSSPMLLDPSKMRQALLNIILNAIDAMPNGGTLTITVIASEASLRGTSTAKQSEKQIATSSPAGTPRNGRLTVAIADTGCGIPKENLSKIFDPFFSTKDAGTGLGLPITHGIIKDHGGEIKVQSEVGKGTKFIIILPNSNSP